MRALTCALAMLLAAGPAAAQESCHDGVIEGDAIRWVSTVRLAGDPIVVPRELEIEHIDGARLGPDSTLLTAIGRGQVRVVSRQPLVDRDHVTLRTPRASGAQRITLAAGRERVRFEPELDGPLERHVGYISAEGVSAELRSALDRECGEPPARSLSIYVTGDHPRLRGAISTRSERSIPFAWLGGALLVLGLVLGGLGYRAFGRRAAIERAEALIEERFDELERDDRRSAH